MWIPSSPSVPLTVPELVDLTVSGYVFIISMYGVMESIVVQLVKANIDRNVTVKIFFFILFSNILTNNIDYI